MRCSSCDADLTNGLRFCGRCGTALEAACGACGRVNPADFRFCGGCGTPLPASAPKSRLAFGPDGGERRHLTILFCDLVGSTELASGLDPEEWRELVRGFQDTASALIARHAGHVAQHLGDGLLAYFGWPLAQGDDAERAVRAALALMRPEFSADPRVVLRIGIHTGMVIVTSVGSGNSAETLALGGAPNVAARVQALAEAGEVLISASTLRLVPGLFTVAERGRHVLKGLPEPLELFRVLRPVGLRRAAARGATAFVGREEERRALAGRLEQARRGEGQVVLLSGEPGIGKSRLAQTVRDDHAHLAFTWLETAGAPYATGTPFHAVCVLLEQAFVSTETDTPEQRAAELAIGLSDAGMDATSAAPILAPLLGAAVPDASPTLSPEALRERLLNTLVEWVLTIARAQPLVILLEDLQWVDPSSLELLSRLLEQTASAPILLLMTARPEFQPPWPLRSNHTQLTLNRLAPRQIRALAESVSVSASETLTSEVLEAVVARADGVPIFAEELTKAAIEVGARGAREIPDTLAGSLMARLDRLGPEARDVALVASVLGREFSRELLHAVHGLPEPALDRALGRLVDADLAWLRGSGPDATYTFKHALVRDAAYAALLKSRRRELHARVALALAERFREYHDAHPDQVAHHYSAADATEPALDAWQRAVEQALARGAHGEALRHTERALALLAALPATPERDSRELRLQLARWQGLLFAKGPATPEAVSALDRAGELGRQADPAQQAILLWGLFTKVSSREGPAAALPLAEQLLDAAERSCQRALQTWAQFLHGLCLYFAGSIREADRAFARALALYEVENAVRVPIDPRVAALPYSALTAWYLGRADEARARAREGVELARARGQPADRAWAESFAGVLSQLLREPEAALAHAEATLAATALEPNPVSAAMGTALSGWARSELGECEAGLAQLKDGVAQFQATGNRISLESTLGALAEAHARAGEPAEALRVLAEAEGIVPGEELHRADTLRRRAELLARTGAPLEEVEAVYASALAWARRQGSLAFELRSSVSYARLLRSRGRTPEAGALLVPVLARFTEGFATRDLQEAQELLGELALPPASARAS